MFATAAIYRRVGKGALTVVKTETPEVIHLSSRVRTKLMLCRQPSHLACAPGRQPRQLRLKFRGASNEVEHSAWRDGFGNVGINFRCVRFGSKVKPARAVNLCQLRSQSGQSRKHSENFGSHSWVVGKIFCKSIGNWRRGWDSNPRDGCPPTRVPGVRLRPLGHLSGNKRHRNTADIELYHAPRRRKHPFVMIARSLIEQIGAKAYLSVGAGCRICAVRWGNCKWLCCAYWVCGSCLGPWLP